MGKSFTAVNLAAGLAPRGRRTLLTDCDPQGNSTSMFDPDDDVEFDIYDLVDEVPPTKVIRQNRLDNLDLVPSTLAVAKLDMSLSRCTAARTSSPSRWSLSMRITTPMVLDLSPNLGQLVITALNAADGSSCPPTPASGAGAGSTCSSNGRHLRQHQVLSATSSVSC